MKDFDLTKEERNAVASLGRIPMICPRVECGHTQATQMRADGRAFRFQVCHRCGHSVSHVAAQPAVGRAPEEPAATGYFGRMLERLQAERAEEAS